MASKNRKGTLVQAYLNDSDLAKLDQLATTLGSERPSAIRFLLNRINVDLKIVAEQPAAKEQHG